jgi:hypothetical protein
MNAIQHPRRDLWRLLKPLCKSGKTEKPIVANKNKSNHVHSPNNLQMVLPLLGERAGVRASVMSNLHFRLRRLFAVPRKIARDRNAQHRPRRIRAFLDLP